MDETTRRDGLRALLRGPCTVTNVRRERFAGGHVAADQVVVSHRLILVRGGALDYTIEGERRRLGAGDWIWAPAWCRREWRTAGRGGCELQWCEFTTDPVSVPAGWFAARVAGAARAGVAARLEAMAARWPARTELDALRLEAETKALAAEFWARAGEGGTRGKGAGAEGRHAEVRRAVGWLEANFARADALEAFYATLGLSPNHFRLLFRRQTGETVQAMLARLRLRRARYLTTETTRSVKEIAAECGYDDPLYFSLHYRRFWGRPPTADREGGARA